MDSLPLRTWRPDVARVRAERAVAAESANRMVAGANGEVVAVLVDRIRVPWCVKVVAVRIRIRIRIVLAFVRMASSDW